MAFFTDSLANLVTGLGLEQGDKKASDRFAFRELPANELDAMCDGDWVAKKIVEVPAHDALRTWRTWAASAKRVTALEDTERRHDVRAKLLEALILARRYGGAAILIGADTANPAEPLRPESVGKGGLRYLTVLRREQLSPGEVDDDVESPGFGRPAYWTLGTNRQSGVRVHPSRLLLIHGAKRYDMAAPAAGWGYSVLQAPYDAVHHAALAAGAGASLLHEAKIDVVNVPNLGSALSTEAGTAAVQRRWSLASLMRSFNRTLLLDGDETWQRSQMAFSGVADMLQRYFAIAAAAADIPAARFLSQQASGLNASGEADVRNYYDRVSSDRERDLRPLLDRLDVVLWRDATGRAKPASAIWFFDPLWQPTEKEKADTAKTVSEVAKTYTELAIFPEVAIAKAVASRLADDGTFPALEQALEEAEKAGEEPPDATEKTDPAGEDDEAGATAAAT